MEQAGDVGRALHGTLASLQENLAVLDILDGAAESWPGVAACMEAMACAINTAADMLLQKADACASAESAQQQSEETLASTRSELCSTQASLQRSAKDLSASQDRLQRLHQEFNATKASLAQERDQLAEQVQCAHSRAIRALVWHRVKRYMWQSC